MKNKKRLQKKKFEVYFTDHTQLRNWIIRKGEEGWKMKSDGLKQWRVPQTKNEVALINGEVLLHDANEMKFASVNMFRPQTKTKK